MATTIAALQKRATEIREETGISENTAERVGSLLYDLAQYMKDELASGAQAEWQADLDAEKTARAAADESLEKKITDGDQELQDLIDSINIILEDLRDGIENSQITFNAGFISKAESIFYDIIRSGYKSASNSAEWAWSIDTAGNILAETLRLRSFLEVPELRYNRATVMLGDEWQAPGGGIIETVTPDTDSDGNATGTGTATLHLESGEIGAVAAGDLCIGYWHYEQGNSTTDADDLKGNIQHAGFTTIFFRIDTVATATQTNDTFTYTLRSSLDTSWASAAQPAVGMHFAVFGNTSDTTRQKSVLRTKTYTRYLAGMDTWTIAEKNIMMQLGDLTGLTIGGTSMEGYSAYLSNIYMKGVIDQLDEKIGEAVDTAVENAAKPALLTLTATSQAFKYERQGDGTVSSTPTPESIKLTATVQNVATPSYKWAYMAAGGGSFTDISSNESRTQDISPTDSIWDGGSVLTLRCTEVTSGVSDTVTLYKLYDGEQGADGTNGANGADAYTVILTNESHTFAAGESAASSTQTAKCGVIAYKGTTQVAAKVTKIAYGSTSVTPNASGTTTAQYLIAGSLYARTYYNNTTDLYLSIVAVKDKLTVSPGQLTLTIEVDGKTFTKIFSWTLSFKGKQGEQGEQGEKGADGLSPAANLLLGAAFNSERDLGEWYTHSVTTNNDYPLTTGQKAAASTVSGTGVFLKQALWKNDGSVTRLLPSTWYTLSFYMRADTPMSVRFINWVRKREHTSAPVLIDTATKGYVDGTETTLTATGKTAFATTSGIESTNGWQRRTLTFKTGEAVGANKNIFGSANIPSAYANDWDKLNVSSRSSVAIAGYLSGYLLSPSNTSGSSALNFVQQTIYNPDAGIDRGMREGVWHTLSFYAKAASAGSVRVDIYGSGGSAVDTSELMYADGDTAGITGAATHTFTLTTSYARHTLTFKSVADFDAIGYVAILFIVPAGGAAVSLTQPKLEEGRQATPFCVSLTDNATESGGLASTMLAFSKTSSSDNLPWLACPKLEIGKKATPWNIADEEKQGVDGCVCRVSEWAAGTEFRNDSALTLSETQYGVRYLDIAVIKNADGSFQSAWQCLKTHTATTGDKPGSGSAYATYWQKFNNMQPIYTPLLLADQAAIRFLQGNQLLIMDTDGTTVCAGMAGGTYPLWVGGTAAVDGSGNIAAPTAFKKDGGGWLAKGNITWDAEGNAAFAGFLKKKKTVISSANVAACAMSLFTYNGNTYYGLAVSQLGGFVELQSGAPAYIYFDETLSSSSYYDNDLCMVGADILVKNNTGGDVRLCNVFEMTEDINSYSKAGTTTLMVTLESGASARLACVFASKDDGGTSDRVCWVLRSPAEGTTFKIEQKTFDSEQYDKWKASQSWAANANTSIG